MVGILVTFLMYIYLFVEYLLLYPISESWIGNFICVILLLIFCMFNTIRQSVWMVNTKVRKKGIVYLILLMNFLAMILVFMVDVIYNLFNSALYVSVFLLILMLLHIILISMQAYSLKKDHLSWKDEYRFLESKTYEIEETKYEKYYLKKYFKYTFFFSLIYLFNEYLWITPIMIVVHCLYAFYSYNNAWTKGYMNEIIYDFEKKNFYIANVLMSIVTIALFYYIPSLIGMILVTLPDLLLRLYLQRYINRML